MMGRISDLSDFGRSLVPYLTWRDERTSLVLLQLSVISGVLTFLVAPFVPWRFVFIIVGEAALLAGHPLAISLASEAAPFLAASSKQFSVRAARLLEDDSLLDEELDAELVEVERFEVEARQDGAWVPDVMSGGELPKGFKWLRVGDWAVDELYGGGEIDEGESPHRRALPAPLTIRADFLHAGMYSWLPLPSSGRQDGTVDGVHRGRSSGPSEKTETDQEGRED